MAKKSYIPLILLLGISLLWSSIAEGLTPKQTYHSAEACYKNLRNSPAKMKYRDNWLRCIEKFQQVYRLDSAGSWAPAGLYKSGQLYQELAKHSANNSDLQEARDIYQRIIKRYPSSRYQNKAALQLRKLAAPKTTKKKTIQTKSKSSSSKASSRPKNKKTSPPIKGMGTVDNLRFWSNPNYSRVVIDASNETTYRHRLLKKDPTLNKPQRLYVDLDRSRLGKNIKRNIPINDDLLIDARAGQYTKDSVRVVVDIKSFQSYKVFSLKDPFRIVIDVLGTTADKIPRPNNAPIVTSKKKGRLPSNALAKQLSLGVSRIIIDPGHGGKDYGAPGYLKGVYEKDIALQISRRLAQKVRSELKYEVYLTRNSDRFLTLEERTAIANTKNADLFISIHTNSHKNRRAYGIETYFLNLATDDEAIRVAAIENATSTKNISDLQTILSDLMQNAKINESSRLAGYVQKSMVGHLKNKRYSRIKSKGVKQAPFYVLLGAQMPAILVETSFISNPRECKRLVNPRYQERLCEAIIQGIRTYINDNEHGHQTR